LKRGDIPPLGNRVEEDGITGSVAKVFWCQEERTVFIWGKGSDFEVCHFVFQIKIDIMLMGQGRCGR
jgi:hypothetical protein